MASQHMDGSDSENEDLNTLVTSLNKQLDEVTQWLTTLEKKAEQPAVNIAGSRRGDVPRYFKLVFPSFDGKKDPLSWLNRCEQFFRAQICDEKDEVWLAQSIA